MPTLSDLTCSAIEVQSDALLMSSASDLQVLPTGTYCVSIFDRHSNRYTSVCLHFPQAAAVAFQLPSALSQLEGTASRLGCSLSEAVAEVQARATDRVDKLTLGWFSLDQRSNEVHLVERDELEKFGANAPLAIAGQQRDCLDEFGPSRLWRGSD